MPLIAFVVRWPLEWRQALLLVKRFNVRIKSIVLSAAAFFGSIIGASAVDEAPHQILLRVGGFEIRQYPVLTVAETTVHADRSSAGSAGFRLLAGYIFGGNAKKQSIAMTTPVIEARPEGVVAAGESEEWVIRFVMPPSSSLSNLPKPNADKIASESSRRLAGPC